MLERHGYVVANVDYPSTTAPIEELAPQAIAVAIHARERPRHIDHEASVRSIGLLYYLMAAVLGLGAIGAIFAGFAPGEDWADVVGMLAVGALFCFVFGAVGRGLRKLRAWIRVPVGILAGLGLIQIPIGTLINGYILFLIFSRKGRTVLSPEYREVIEQTPHIKPRTSIVVWLALGLIVTLIVLAIAIPAFS